MRHRLLTCLCCAALQGCYVLLIFRHMPTFRDSIPFPSYGSGCPGRNLRPLGMLCSVDCLTFRHSVSLPSSSVKLSENNCSWMFACSTFEDVTHTLPLCDTQEGWRPWLHRGGSLESPKGMLTSRVSRECGSFDIWYDIFVSYSLVVNRWQYTFPHKQYIEQHKYQPNNTNNN